MRGRGRSCVPAFYQTPEPLDAARRPGRQFVIQKARHDQKVYALPFSCQLVRPGRRSLTYAQPATFPLLVQGAACSLWCPFAVRSLPATFLLLVQRGQFTLRQKGKLRWNSSCLAVLRGLTGTIPPQLIDDVFGWCLLMVWASGRVCSVIIA